MQTYDPNKSTTEVRQASPRLGNFRVLIFSMLGVVVLFAIIFMLFTVFAPGPANPV
jgi:hypothetical protein